MRRARSAGIQRARTARPRKFGPSGLRRRHRREVHGEPAQTGPWGSQSAAGHTNARRAATRARPPLPSRTASAESLGSHHDRNNSGFTTKNRSGSLNIIQHVRPLGCSGWYNYYGCASIEDMAEQFPGRTFQGSGSADVDYLLHFLSITNYTDDLLGDSAG